MTWSLVGKYPRILQDEVVGEEAGRLFVDANAMLDRLDAGGLLRPRGVVGLFPANREGDDIAIYRDESRRERLAVAYHLRQQTEKSDFANYCLADFVAPKASGKADYLGAFAVTGGLEEDSLAAEFYVWHYDYKKIMVKALADRLAEAFAEYLHERVCKVYWGYVANEILVNEALIRESYQGIRRRQVIPPALTIPKSKLCGHFRCDASHRYATDRIVRHVAGGVVGGVVL